MAFYRVPTKFLLAILCALTTLSLRFHGAHIVCTALSRRSHCAFTAFALTSRQELPSRGKFNTIVYINTCKILIY